MFASAPALSGKELEAAVSASLNCGVSSSVVEEVERAARKGAGKEDAAGRIIRLLGNACRASLPMEMLERKVAEGLVKRVPLQRIAVFLERKVADYEFVRRLMETVGDRKPDEQLRRAVTVMGEALASGVSRKELQDMVFAFSEKELPAVTLGVEFYSYLSLAGVNRADCMRILEAGFANDSLTPAWLGFPRVVALAKRRGVNDREIADAAEQALKEKGDVKSAMMRLGFTSRPVPEPKE